MKHAQIGFFLRPAILAASLYAPLVPGWAQSPRNPPTLPNVAQQPDAERTQNQLNRLLSHYPPTLKSVLALDPSLMNNPLYLSPYPDLVNLLNEHPEIARSPSFYFGAPPDFRYRPREIVNGGVWRQLFEALSVFAGFGMAIGLLTWLVRTVIDYRRWNRLTKIQTDVHTKLLDRFTANDQLLAYIQSPAGSKFLESSPITLDAGPRSLGAPLGRILWSVQAGLVLIAAGFGLLVVSGRFPDDAAQPLHAIGVLAIALGLGFAASAVISFVISQRLGLVEFAGPASRSELPGRQA